MALVFLGEEETEGWRAISPEIEAYGTTTQPKPSWLAFQHALLMVLMVMIAMMSVFPPPIRGTLMSSAPDRFQPRADGTLDLRPARFARVSARFLVKRLMHSMCIADLHSHAQQQHPASRSESSEGRLESAGPLPPVRVVRDPPGSTPPASKSALPDQRFASRAKHLAPRKTRVMCSSYTSYSSSSGNHPTHPTRQAEQGPTPCRRRRRR
jgi:hypothetical protein